MFFLIYRLLSNYHNSIYHGDIFLTHPTYHQVKMARNTSKLSVTLTRDTCDIIFLKKMFERKIWLRPCWMDFLCIISQEVLLLWSIVTHSWSILCPKMGKKHSTLNVTRATEIKIKHFVESPWSNLMQRLEWIFL